MCTLEKCTWTQSISTDLSKGNLRTCGTNKDTHRIIRPDVKYEHMKKQHPTPSATVGLTPVFLTALGQWNQLVFFAETLQRT